MLKDVWRWAITLLKFILYDFIFEELSAIILIKNLLCVLLDAFYVQALIISFDVWKTRVLVHSSIYYENKISSFYWKDIEIK